MQIDSEALLKKLTDLPVKDKKIVDELNLISKKLTVLVLLPRKKGEYRDAIVFCEDHPGDIFVKRVDNIRRNPTGGCLKCGTKSKAAQSHKDFVKDRIPDCIREKVMSIEIDNTEWRDRTDLIATVVTKHYRVTARQRNLKNALLKIDEYANRIISRHGTFVDFTIAQDQRNITFEATSIVDGRKSRDLRTVLVDWMPRADPGTREKLKARLERAQISPYDVFRTSGQESKPANLVRKLVAKYGNSTKPVEEMTFVGLSGKKRLLRIDFYYPDLNLLVEVQSILHERSIEHFGGDAAFEQRVEYDKEKIRFWENELMEKGVQLKHIRGDGNLREVEEAVRLMVEDALSAVVGKHSTG